MLTVSLDIVYGIHLLDLILVKDNIRSRFIILCAPLFEKASFFVVNMKKLEVIINMDNYAILVFKVYNFFISETDCYIYKIWKLVDLYILCMIGTVRRETFIQDNTCFLSFCNDIYIYTLY